MRRVAHVPANDVNEERVALGGPYRRQMPDRPEDEASDPQPESEADRSRKGAIDDRDRARRAGNQERLRERPMNRRVEYWDQVMRNDACHQMSVPAANEKKER